MQYLAGVVFMCLFQSTIVGVLAGRWISYPLRLNEQINSIKNVVSGAFICHFSFLMFLLFHFP